MKLLFDENLSDKLQELLRDMFPGSLHVKSCGLAGSDDLAIWRYAAEHGLVLVTKDEDFLRLSTKYGAPPKVLYLGVGNCSVPTIENVLRTSRPQIDTFAADPDELFLILP